MLGSNFLKKSLTLLSILNDKLSLGEKYLFTKKYKPKIVRAKKGKGSFKRKKSYA